MLDGALPERRLVAHDDGTAVVLQRRRKNFGSRSAGAVGQNDERPAVDCLGVAGVFLVAIPAPIDRLDHRTLLDEKAGHVDRLLQRSTAVVSKIDDQSVDPLDRKTHEQRPNIGSRAGIASIHIGIEGREGDPAELLFVAFRILRDDKIGRGQTFLEVDLLTNDVDDLDLVLPLDRRNLEPNRRSDLTADEVDDVGKLHFDDIFEIAFLALGDADDAVFYFQLPVLEGRSADDEALDRGAAVLFVTLEHRTDTGERLVHSDAEVLVLRLREIFGVRIVGAGDRLDEKSGDVLRVVFLNPFLDSLVAF